MTKLSTSISIDIEQIDFAHRNGLSTSAQIQEDLQVIELLEKMALESLTSTFSSTNIVSILKALEGVVYSPHCLDILPQIILTSVMDYYGESVSTTLGSIAVLQDVKDLSVLEAHVLFHISRRPLNPQASN